MPKATGATVKDVPADALIRAYAAHIKASGLVREPEWVEYVKTGPMKELSPSDRDWLYVRMASLARRVYLRQHTGVGTFSKVYGSRQRNGTSPAHFRRASRKVIRHCLQELERLGVVARSEDGSGRVLTRKGRQELDTQATRVRAELLAAIGASAASDGVSAVVAGKGEASDTVPAE